MLQWCGHCEYVMRRCEERRKTPLQIEWSRWQKNASLRGSHETPEKAKKSQTFKFLKSTKYTHPSPRNFQSLPRSLLRTEEACTILLPTPSHPCLGASEFAFLLCLSLKKLNFQYSRAKRSTFRIKGIRV